MFASLGHGWFLESLRVRSPDSGRDAGRGGSKEYLFPCSRWFDTAQDDRKIVRELYPVETTPQGTQSMFVLFDEL